MPETVCRRELDTTPDVVIHVVRTIAIGRKDGAMHYRYQYLTVQLRDHGKRTPKSPPRSEWSIRTLYVASPGWALQGAGEKCSGEQ